MTEVRKLIHKLEESFKDSILGAGELLFFPFVHIEAPSLLKVLSFCKEDPSFQFNFLECITAVDMDQEFLVIYQLSSLYDVGFASRKSFGDSKQRLNIKVAVNRYAASLPSVVKLWYSAFSYEREVAEMFGIFFDGHPNLSHLLLPEDWSGYPLRKDYKYPEVYQGIEHHRPPLRKEHSRP